MGHLHHLTPPAISPGSLQTGDVLASFLEHTLIPRCKASVCHGSDESVGFVLQSSALPQPSVLLFALQLLSSLTTRIT